MQYMPNLVIYIMYIIVTSSAVTKNYLHFSYIFCYLLLSYYTEDVSKLCSVFKLHHLSSHSAESQCVWLTFISFFKISLDNLQSQSPYLAISSKLITEDYNLVKSQWTLTALALWVNDKRSLCEYAAPLTNSCATHPHPSTINHESLCPYFSIHLSWHPSTS